MPELPPELVPYANALGILLAALLIGRRYFKSYMAEDAPKSSAEVQIVGGALADRASTMTLAASVDRLSAVLDRLAEFLEKDADRREHAAEIAELKRQIADMKR